MTNVVVQSIYTPTYKSELINALHRGAAQKQPNWNRMDHPNTVCLIVTKGVVVGTG